MASFDAPNYFISIGCFIVSIISIMCGFKGKYKSLRIYGLILSMISIFKLIMIDINYENTLGNAFSFLLLNMMLAVDLLYIVFIMLRNVSSIPNLLKNFILLDSVK